MKLAPDVFRKQTVKSCICGRVPNERASINVQLAKRGMWMVGISFVALVSSALVLGPADVLSRAWWVFALYGILVISLAVTARRKTSEGHTLRCAVRYACLKVF